MIFKIYSTIKEAPIQGLLGAGGGIGSFSNASSGTPATAKFSWNIDATFTLYPMTFGFVGPIQYNWDTIMNQISFPPYSARNSGVAASECLSYVTHPDNPVYNSRTTKILGVTGFPGGVYEFTLRGGGGANADPGYGAPGGLGAARMTLTISDTIYLAIGQGGVYTGGANRSNNAGVFPQPGGWNGGGAAGAQQDGTCYSGSGGGGTDVRLNGTASANRVLVVGGGGGGTDQGYNTGGQGGGFNLDGQMGGYGTDNIQNAAGQGGTSSAGGAGAYEDGTKLGNDGGLWFGGAGYDGSQPVDSSNAAGGAGGGYYGGGGAADEIIPSSGGPGGGSGYLNTSVATQQSTSSGGANNGSQNWSWRASSVDQAGRSTAGFRNYNYTGTATQVSSNNFNDSSYSSYYNNSTANSIGTISTINYRFGGNGSIGIKRIS